jgi:hypothetical protein
MAKKMKPGLFLIAASLGALVAFSVCALAQQTLGGITGTVTDPGGSVLPDTSVTIVGDQTKLTRTIKTNANGAYDFVNLPIGTYTLTVTHDGFQSQKLPSIPVQADRTATLNVLLKVGQVGTTVEVTAVPVMNAVDTTNGYVLEDQQIQSIPLPTGSFTGLAILSPGVSAELNGGSGVNTGLGNQPIWANGQRDTSNSFLVNGVDASNLFNGKSTSQVASARIVNNTGVANAASTSAAPIQSTASVYLAIGQALPTPAPETVQELRVNTSMYDAQQGSTSGAHIDMSTASGTNLIHGQLWANRESNWLNAAPFFDKQDPNIPANDKVPQLHRDILGGELGGPLIRNKLFGFISYQRLHDSDQEIGLSRLLVPSELTDNNRTPQGLAQISNDIWGTTLTGNGDVSPVAVALLQAKLPNGQYMIPSADGQIPTAPFPENAISPGTAYFFSDQAVANLDWNQSTKDTLSAKYYYQHDPSIAPYAYSSVAGFAQHHDAGSQVASITNAQSIRPNLSVTEVLGILREKVYSTIEQPFGPDSIGGGINTFGSPYFPGITIADPLGLDSAANPGTSPLCPQAGGCPVENLQFLTIGQGAASQGAFTGVFQNRIMPSANAIWMRGRHTITFGGSYSYTQLNTRDERTNQGMISTADFSQFLQGFVNTNDDFTTTKFLQGNANRYYRAGQAGAYVQDKFQIRPNLSLTGGLRFDWDGGLTEKFGRIFNFDPSLYSYDDATDTITSNGFIIAGNNNLFPTKGVSKTTLTGRQWGFAPRGGAAWSPKKFNDKVVVRAGMGLYYDRGELYTYLSPGFAEGVINGGPFGVNQTPPYVNAQSCNGATESYYLGYIPTCNSQASMGYVYSLSNPWGQTLGPAPSGNPADITQYLPNEAGILAGDQLFSFATYNRTNKLPYTINQTLDVQWQPRNDLMIEVGYVGNLGRHGVIPIPFNQPDIATPTNVIHPNSANPQSYTYGYTVQNDATCSPYCPINLPNGQPMVVTYEGGNVDLRVPYIGYSAESETYKAAGVSAYNALQTHVEKRMSHGLQVGFSYTYSHALDEQSGMGLFFNGNNPLNLRSAYGSADFDRTHVFNFSYVYQLPKFFGVSTLKGKLADGWAIQGITVIQSGQPYSIIDYTGAVGSIYFSVYDGITNPVVPLAPGCTAKSARTGASGAFGTAALNSSCFTLPLLNPGDLNGAIPAGDTFETNFTSGQRNIFRQAWQKRADISLVKNTQITERYSLKYTFDVFNATNTASFDIPIDDVSQNEFYNQFPVQGQPLYNPPSGLGAVNKTIGGPRQIQMTLHFVF